MQPAILSPWSLDFDYLWPMCIIVEHKIVTVSSFYLWPREYALFVDIIIFLLCFFNLYVPICRISRGTHRTILLRTRTRRRPSGHLRPPDLSSECLVVLLYWTYYTYQTIFYVMDLCYVSDLWYMWWTSVICIDAILVIVNYIFVIITACNDPCIYIYFCCICIEKQRKKKQKIKEKLATLPSA